MSKNGVLIINHGSKRAEANQDFLDLCQQVRDAAPDQIIQESFLDLQHPNVIEGLEKLYQGGSTIITVVPYFLSRGKHTQIHIPKLIEDFLADHPDLKIEVQEPLGVSKGMVELLIGLIQAQTPQSTRRP